MTAQLPALRFEAEAFQLGADKILGRQSAGEAFLRAVLGLPELAGLIGCGPNGNAKLPFARIVSALRRDVAPGWVPLTSHGDLARIGALHFPDPMIHSQARGRMAVGSQAYSLTGITHTIASANTMRGIAEFTSAPLMEWDGVICTSDAVKASVLEIVEEQESYHAWRFGGTNPPPRLQLPVIPLGVHAKDFAFSEDQRAEARRALGLGAGDVAFLFVGRLSFHAKANPFPMYAALEAAAKQTGKRIALIQCGWFANDAIAKAFKEAATAHAPSVRHLFLDGRKPPERDRAWAAGDVFMSLSDNIQETFGLTPLEAMAAGLPVIVTDWDGYRQTVRHGETGFMVPTYAPPAPAGERFAEMHAAELINYDYYLALTSLHIAVDLAALIEATCTLVRDGEKRRTMGEAGRKLAREVFDWSVLIRDYQAFWAELARIRLAVKPDDPRCLPRPSAERLDPFRLFANYPTEAIDAASRLRRREGGGDVAKLLADPLFAQARTSFPDMAPITALLKAIGSGNGRKLADAVKFSGLDMVQAQLVATLLLKLGVLEIG